MLDSFRTLLGVRHGSDRIARRHCLALEGLEQRCLLSGDVVLDWNATLLQAVRVNGTPPPLAARDMAMVHVAIFDAVDTIEPAYASFPVPGLAAVPAPGASAEVAAVAAADRVLDSVFPTQAATFDAQLAA